MHDIVTISSPDYVVPNRARDYRCARTSAADLEHDLPRISELAESGRIQMLEVDCRKSNNISSLALVSNIEFVRLISDKPLSLPAPSTKPYSIKALSCSTAQFNSDLFPEISWLSVYNLDFSKSIFRTAKSLRRLCVTDFLAEDQMIELAGASNLVELELFRSTSLLSLDVLSELHELRNLSLARLREVSSLTPIARMEGLRNLSLERMKKIESYRPISELKNLEKLMIVDSAEIDFLSSAQTDSMRMFKVYGTKRANQIPA